MPREADADFIIEHLHMFDRVQVPGGMWTQADLIHREGGVFYRSQWDSAPLPLPVGSQVQAPGLGIIKYTGARARV